MYETHEIVYRTQFRFGNILQTKILSTSFCRLKCYENEVLKQPVEIKAFAELECDNSVQVASQIYRIRKDK